MTAFQKLRAAVQPTKLLDRFRFVGVYVIKGMNHRDPVIEVLFPQSNVTKLPDAFAESVRRFFSVLPGTLLRFIVFSDVQREGAGRGVGFDMDSEDESRSSFLPLQTAVERDIQVDQTEWSVPSRLSFFLSYDRANVWSSAALTLKELADLVLSIAENIRYDFRTVWRSLPRHDSGLAILSFWGVDTRESNQGRCGDCKLTFHLLTGKLFISTKENYETKYETKDISLEINDHYHPLPDLDDVEKRFCLRTAAPVLIAQLSVTFHIRACRDVAVELVKISDAKLEIRTMSGIRHDIETGGDDLTLAEVFPLAAAKLQTAGTLPPDSSLVLYVGEQRLKPDDTRLSQIFQPVLRRRSRSHKSRSQRSRSRSRRG